MSPACPQSQTRNRPYLNWRHRCISHLVLGRRLSPAARAFALAASTPSPAPDQAGGPTSAPNAILPIVSVYTSQAYTHKRAVGPVQLEVVPGKGLGWRATRDIATGELLLVSLPIAVLYGPPGEPPDNEELVQALASSWPRMTPLERSWLLLLGDCCAARGGGANAAPAVDRAQEAGAPAAPSAAVGQGEAAAREGSPASPSSSPSAGRHSAEALLLRARALLAEAQQTAEAKEEELQRRAAGIPPTAAPPPPSSSSSSSSFSAAATASAAPAAAGLHILPPAIFGSTSTSTSTSSARTPSNTTTTSRGGGGSGGLVLELVSRYSYAESREDPALAELLELDTADASGPSSSSSSSGSLSCAGLWPEASLLNHSCCPNAGILVVGGAAYVRAGRPVMEGEELTVSYLGTGVFRHVAERRSRLRASHDFLCTCPRCTAEHEHFPTRRYPELEQQRKERNGGHRRVQQGGSSSSSSSSSNTGGGGGGSAAALDDALLAERLMGRGRGGGGGPLQALLDAVFGAGRFRAGGLAPDHGLLARLGGPEAAELEAEAQAALTAPSAPRQRQAATLAKLEALIGQVEGSCSFLELPPRGRLMVLASVYGIVRLTSDLAELSGQATPERRLQLLQLAAEVLEAVAPGSDGHVTAALKAAGVARRVHGADSAPARRADLAAATAHLARYGRELLAEPTLLRRLADTRRRLVAGSGLAASMGVLAWLQQAAGPE